FYTVTLPVTLWFLDKTKTGTEREDTVLFIDARNLYRQIDRAHRDFLPEQIELLANIVRLYRGEDVETADGSDTLLKDHFMPFSKRDALGPKGLRPMLRRLIKGPIPPRVVSPEHTTGRAQLEIHLRPEIREQVRARKAERMEAVRRVRPSSAEEWHRFWPCSRQDDSSHTLGNTRIAISDTLFAHTDIVEVARDLSSPMRVGGSLADAVFMKICGPLASITNANTGLPANASPRALRAQQKRKRLEKQLARNAGERTDWNAVENSWADPVAMQKHAPGWIDKRARLSGSPAISLLDQLLERGGEQMIGSYQDDLPSTTNHIAMQMMLWADTLLRHTQELSQGASC
ncbi:MAG: N-6 DNA methylase, partial [Phycisphaerales bacterium]|nr:N-6 DNA methylase [Phycisphaerales bacterium]